MYTNPTRLHSKPTRIKSTGTEVGQALFGETLGDLHEVTEKSLSVRLQPLVLDSLALLPLLHRLDVSDGNIQWIYTWPCIV